MVTDEPNVVGRIVAYLHHEVAGSSIEPYRRAGAVVFSLRERLEHLRLAAMVEHRNGWEYPGPLQTALLCGWNAFALQLLADQLIEYDYEADPLTVGFVDASLAHQATLLFGQVPRWVSRAEQALQNPSYRLDVTVPAPLPEWPEDRPTPNYVWALLGALRVLRRHVEPAVATEAAFVEGSREQAGHGLVLQLMAESQAAADYAHGLWTGDEAIASEVAAQARAALDRLYVAGQLVAMPSLTSQPLPKQRATRRVTAGAAPLLPRPGETGFDPWCLTDQRARKVLSRDGHARRTIERLWAADPDPVRTLALKRDIDSALLRGDVALDAGHLATCPWAPIYLVKRAVRLGPTEVHPLEQCTLDLAIEPAPGRGRARFRRRILRGPFFPARR